MLLSTMTMEGMGPFIAVEGATTKAFFEFYVEEGTHLNFKAWAGSGDG